MMKLTTARRLRVISVLFSVLLCYGCGQTGPLYMPGDPSRVQAPPDASESLRDMVPAPVDDEADAVDDEDEDGDDDDPQRHE